jgi:phage/plasmid-associated DNA primase
MDIAGAVEWQRIGLCPPAAVIGATDEYMDEEAEDVLSAWMHECCEIEIDPKAETLIGALYRSFKFYAEQAGEKVMTNAMFGKELKNLEFKSRRTGRQRYVMGIKLAPPPLRRKSPNRDAGHSYGLKHAAQKWADGYIANGALIAAAVHLDFPIVQCPSGINCWIGVASMRKWPSLGDR